MARYEMAPTKTNLMKVKRDLGFAREGWELLDQKRKILVVELMGLIDRAVEAQEEVESKLAEAGNVVVSSGELQAEIDTQRVELVGLRARNEALQAEVNDLKRGLEAIEERARNELGMTKSGEVFYQIMEQEP